MSYHRKKILLLLTLATLITFSVLTFIFRPLPINDTTPISPEEEDLDAFIDQVEEKDEEVTTAANEFSLSLREAFQQTLTVFNRTDLRIAALGDSLTQGVGDESNQQGYVGVLDRKLQNHDIRAQIDNFGRRGSRTDHLLESLEEDNDKRRAVERSDIVLITIGGNDIMRIVRENVLNLNVDLFETERIAYTERLYDIFDLITAYNPDASIYLIGIFNPFYGYFEEVEALEDIVTTWTMESREVIESYPNGTFIPVHDLFLLEDINLLADDNFHPNETGYQLMGNRVYHTLTPLLDRLHDQNALDDDAFENVIEE